MSSVRLLINLEDELELLPESKIVCKRLGYNFYFGRFQWLVVKFGEIEA